MAYVCEQLSSPKLLTGSQTCQKWVEQAQTEQPSNMLLPELTANERDQILIWIIAIFAVVFAVKRLRRMLGS